MKIEAPQQVLTSAFTRQMQPGMVIDACTPWNRREDWPETVLNSAGLEQAVREKFAGVLPPGW